MPDLSLTGRNDDSVGWDVAQGAAGEGPGNTWNVFDGQSDAVVQASVVHGGVHINQQPGTALPIPRQLPRDATVFVDRSAEIGSLTDLLQSPDTPPQSQAQVVLVIGAAGVGKTALAVRWANQVRAHFPDGQLYVDLRGYDQRPPLSSEEALDGFLRALNVEPDRIPTSLDALAGFFRSQLDGRRLLVMLDNARSAEQIRPLLPPSAGSLALVTSRSRLAGLIVRDGAVPLPLHPLQPPDALRLFETVAGGVARGDEHETVSVLVRQCAYLPLTVRIVAEQAATRFDTSLVELAAELEVERNRLDVLATADDDESSEVRNVLSWSYGALSPEVRRVFRLLGLHAGPDVSTAAVAALAGVPPTRVQRALTSLVNVHMLEAVGRDRFRFHDLLRAYAVERAEAEEPEDDRLRAQRRELDWYLRSADAADRVLAPNRRHVPLEPAEAPGAAVGFADYDDAIAWCEAERANLLAAIDEAAAIGADDIAWKLPVALVTFFHLRKHRMDRLATTLKALDAARRAGDGYGEAWSLICVGGSCLDLRRTEEGAERFHAALDKCREIGDRQGEGMCLENLCDVYCELGRATEAMQFGEQALAVWREVGDRRVEGITLCTLGEVATSSGRFPEALSYYRRALPLCQATDRYSEADVLYGFGDVHDRLGEDAEAAGYFERVLALRRELGDRHGEARALRRLAVLHARNGRTAEAMAAWAEALAIFRDLDDPEAADVEAEMAADDHG